MSSTIAYGLLAHTCASSTAELTFLTAAASIEYNGVLRVVNIDTTDAQDYGIAHCAASGTAANSEWIVYPGTPIAALSVPHEYSIHLGKSEELRVQSSTADKVTYHFSGEKKITEGS